VDIIEASFPGDRTLVTDRIEAWRDVARARDNAGDMAGAEALRGMIDNIPVPPLLNVRRS
jgi:hypothetical protein